MSYTDHLDFYRHGPYSQFLVEHHATGSAPIGLYKASQPAGHFPDPAFPNLLLYVAEKGTRDASFDWGAGKWRGRWQAGDLTLVPSDCASDVELSDRHEFLALSIPSKGLGDLLGERAPALVDGLAPLHARPFRDRFVAVLCHQIWHEAATGSRHGSLFADGALTSLLARLANLADARCFDLQRPGLSGPVLDRVIDYVHAHLSADLTVGELAAVAGCSAGHFSRMFAATTSITPYQFVLNCRLEKAKALLLSGRMAIADIAATTGFSSQSHLTDQFRRRFGTSPGKFARRLP